MEQQGICKMKKFDKILWVDPNNITNQFIELGFYFGSAKIKHFKLLLEAKSYAKEDMHSKFVVMVSWKVFSAAGRDMQIFDEVQNVFPKYIIFCGNKHTVNLDTLSQQHVFDVVDETYFIKETIEKIEIQIEKKSTLNQSSRLFFASGETNSQLKTSIQSEIKKLYWEGITITTLTFKDIFEHIDDEQTPSYVYSVANEIKRDEIYHQLQEKQTVAYWHEIRLDEEEVDPYEVDQLTLNCISIKQFSKIVHKEAVGETQE